MKRLRSFSRFLPFFACALLTLSLHTGSNAQSSNVIHVWIIGSPLNGELPREVVPPQLSRRAESLGYKIEVESLRASGFAARVRLAVQDHHEPEILSFSNYGVIRGMQTPAGWFEGIDSDRRAAPSLALVHETMTSLQSRGWVMLVRSAPNYEAAPD